MIVPTENIGAPDFEASASRVRVLGSELLAIVRQVGTLQAQLHDLHVTMTNIVTHLPVNDPRTREFEQLYIEFSRAMLMVRGGFELTLLCEQMKYFSGGRN